MPGLNLADHAQADRRFPRRTDDVCGAYGKSVHGAVVPRGQCQPTDRSVGEHAPEGFRQRDLRGRQRRQAGEHLRARVLETDERRRVGAHPAATNLNARRRARAHTDRPPTTPRTPSAAEVNSQNGVG